MYARKDPVIRCAILCCIFFASLIGGTCSGFADPIITIDGNDDSYVWGSVNDVAFPLRFVILIYGKHTDGKWYGPVNTSTDLFPEITPDKKWKGRYTTGSENDNATAFTVYLVKKGVNMNQVKITGAGNLKLYYADVIASTEGEKK
jgi:hypothetical protein